MVKFVDKERAAFVVLNQLQALAQGVESREERGVRDGLAAQGFQVAPVALHRLNDFTRCLNDGRVAQEFEPEGRAAGEIRALFSWIRQEATAHG